ncbi:MAG: hypothetical protein ACQERB_11625 [Promethearchaeati archaeon]
MKPSEEIKEIIESVRNNRYNVQCAGCSKENPIINLEKDIDTNLLSCPSCNGNSFHLFSDNASFIVQCNLCSREYRIDDLPKNYESLLYCPACHGSIFYILH